MTDYFDYISGVTAMDNVVEFKRPDKREIEHCDSTTIVERMEMTTEMKQAFEDAGYTIEKNAESFLKGVWINEN